MLNKGYLGEVNLIEDDSEPNQRESSRCYENCLRCSEKQNLKEKRNEDDINKRNYIIISFHLIKRISHFLLYYCEKIFLFNIFFKDGKHLKENI